MLPLAYACLHDEIQVEFRDGTETRGFSLGAEWWQGPDGPQPLLQVEPDGADLVVACEADLATVTPIGGYTARADLLRAVSRAVDEATVSVDEDPRYVHLLVGHHERVEVTVRLERHPCAPPPPPAVTDFIQAVIDAHDSVEPHRPIPQANCRRD